MVGGYDRGGLIVQIEITIDESQDETAVSTRFDTDFGTYWKDTYIDTGKYDGFALLEMKVLETIQEQMEEVQDDITFDYGGNV